MCLLIAAVHPEQPDGGEEHAATEPPAGVRPAPGPDCHEDRRPTGCHGNTAGMILAFHYMV